MGKIEKKSYKYKQHNTPREDDGLRKRRALPQSASKRPSGNVVGQTNEPKYHTQAHNHDNFLKITK